MAAEGIPLNKNLPVIETGAEAQFRAKEVVVDRAIALTIVALKGEGLEQDRVIRMRDQFSAAAYFSPKENAFLLDPNPTRIDRTQFAWRYECLGVMLWALGFTSGLTRPSGIVDAGKVVSLVKDPQAFRAQARLRAGTEILDEADLIYRYDWACVDARVNRKPAPKAINCEVVLERHHALNWLIGYQGQEWDDVTTDT